MLFTVDDSNNLTQRLDIRTILELFQSETRMFSRLTTSMVDIDDPLTMSLALWLLQDLEALG